MQLDNNYYFKLVKNFLVISLIVILETLVISEKASYLAR